MEKNRIFFHKPNHELFKSLGLNSVDMHFHTKYSDSYTRVQTVLKKAKRLSIGVAITDHNTIKGSLEASHNNLGVMIVPGIEVSCIEGAHILLYFYSFGELEECYNKHIKPFRHDNPFMATKIKVEDLIEKTKNYNCIRCAAHPYGYLISNCGLSKCVSKHYVSGAVFDSIDAMEVVCGAMNRRLNKKAINTTMELGKGFTGGTDGHTILELGKVVTSTYADNLDTFLTNVLKKKNYVVGKETRLSSKFIPSTNMLSRHMRYAVPSIKLQYALNKSRVKNMPRKIKARVKNMPKKIIRKTAQILKNGKK